MYENALDIIKKVQQRNINPIRAIQSSEVQNAVNSQAQNDWSLTDIPNGLFFGAADTLVSGVPNTAGFTLANLGSAWEWLTPWNGVDNQRRLRLIKDNVLSQEKIDELTPYRDSWLTSGAKQFLDWGNSAHNYITDVERDFVGENPSELYNISRGAGTSLGFLGLDLVTTATSGIPFLGALVGGSTEAAFEAGNFLSEANAQGKYREALPVSRANFLTNAAFNTALNYGGRHILPLIPKSTNPLGVWAARSLGEVVNETLQEPGQDIIEQASQNALENNAGFFGFFPELLNELPNYPEKFAELFPEVAGSTMLTNVILPGIPSYRRDIVRESLQNGTKVKNGTKTALQETRNYLNEQNNNLTQQSEDLINILNNQNQNIGNDIDFEPQAEQDIQNSYSDFLNTNTNIQSNMEKIKTIDNRIKAIDNNIPLQFDNSGKENHVNVNVDTPNDDDNLQNEQPLQDDYDDNDTQRKHIEEALIKAGRSNEEAHLASKLTATGIRKIAEWGGVDPNILFDNLDINYVKEIPIQKYIDGKYIKVNEANAQTNFDRKNNQVLTGRTANIKLNDKSNVSSFIHENGHYFFDLMNEISKLDNSSDEFKNDWGTLKNWLNISDINTKNTPSEESNNRWHDAHEKFATALEKYIMEGDSPTPELNRVFERFKRWLTNVYKTLSSITYLGTDGKRHSYRLNNDIRAVFDDLFSPAKNSNFAGANYSDLSSAQSENNRVNNSLSKDSIQNNNFETNNDLTKGKDKNITPTLTETKEISTQINNNNFDNNLQNNNEQDKNNIPVIEIKKGMSKDDVIKSFLDTVGNNKNFASINGKSFSKNDYDASISVPENSKFKTIVDKINNISHNPLSEDDDNIISEIKNLLQPLNERDLKDFFNEINFNFNENDTKSRLIYSFAKKTKSNLRTPFKVIREKLSAPTRDFDDNLNEALSSANNNETYNQIISVKGAREMDKEEGITTRMDFLKLAKKLKTQKVDPKTIWRQTGWEYGYDKKWIYEIPDGNFKSFPLKDIQNQTVGDIFNAPELFKAYPEIKNLDFEFADLDPSTLGYYSSSDKKIVLNSNPYRSDKREFRRTMIHELQHAIQDIEKLSRKSKGNIYSEKADKYMDDIKYLITMNGGNEKLKLHRIVSYWQHYQTDEATQLINSLPDKYQKLIDKLEKIYDKYEDNYEKYKYSSDEVQSRNTEKRLFWGEKRRKATPLSQTEDTSRSEFSDTYYQILGEKGANSLDGEKHKTCYWLGTRRR